MIERPASTHPRRAFGASLLAGLVALSVGCSSGPPSHNKDPQKGKVWTVYSDCTWGSCEFDWKVCIGPDLLMHLDGANPEDRTVKDSPECAHHNTTGAP